ncbi:MAG: 3-dehydroquinate synthase [Lacunisphaera sp.]|nr:3-dehydroquinate synthase [Lacunisphaera sp.]
MATSTLTLRLSGRTGTLRIGSDLASVAGPELKKLRRANRRWAVVVDAAVARRHGALLRRVFGPVPCLVLPGGERSKNFAGYQRILAFLSRARLDRAGVLIAVGGGVVGDVAGFAAATYLRGIDVFQVPTTLLAMVDSSVGGKTGINLPAGKNLAGAFHQPVAVAIATDFLRTLPAREFAAGMAEVLKYGLLGDAALFARLARTPLRPDSADLPRTIRRCVALKAAIVAADERETAREGGRALLNLGHTFGHAIEHAAGYGVYLHGEAVAIGLVGAARLSEKLGHLPPGAASRIARVLATHRLPVRLRSPLPAGTLLRAMGQDKKNRGGRLRFVVLHRIGQASTADDVPSALVRAVWRELGAG